MRNPGGYGIITDINGNITEHDTFTCHHCNRMRPLKVGEAPEWMCKHCEKFICNDCVGKGCKTWEDQLKIIEDRYHSRRMFEAL